MKKRILAFLIIAISYQLTAIDSLFAQTGTWTALKNLPPRANNGVCLLMTDGTVLCKSIPITDSVDNGRGWDRLTPDAHGSYINGTWDTIAPMHYDRLFFSTQVLPTGKVYVAGGEYGPGGTRGEVYDPVTNTWTMCDTIPKGWNIYDGNSELLCNGNVLEGPQIGSYNSYNTLLWSPLTYKYTVGPLSNYNHDEAEWLKLPDSTVLFVGKSSQGTSRYSPQTGNWAFDASTPGQLYDQYGQEAGCALMLPNGKAIFFGGTPYNCIYTPSGKHNINGSWVSADSFPKINGTYMGQPDASGAMMVNGHILLAVSPIGTGPNTEFNSPAYFLEYDYTTGKFTRVKATMPGQGGDSIAYIAAYQTQMLDLPDGNVLVSISQTGTLTNQYYIYTPGSGPIPQGKPTINNVIALNCTSYKITGKLFNGISEGAAYGDDWQMSTNYPLVRLTNGTNVYYAKTTNWNRIGAVQTDSLEDTAYFTLPSIPTGTYSLVVVANGFASNPVLFNTFNTSVAVQNVLCNGENDGKAWAVVTGGQKPLKYVWNPGGATKDTATGLSAGTYTVTVSDSCASVTAAVTITQPPAYFIIGDGNAIGTGWVMVSGATKPYTYLWDNGATTDSIFNQKTGKYCCRITDGNGCVDTFCVYILNDAGVNNLAQENGNITVYPNPGNGVFSLIDNSQLAVDNANNSVEVYNTLGQLVFSELSIVHFPLSINLSKQPNGIYFYRVFNNTDGTLLGDGKLIIAK